MKYGYAVNIKSICTHSSRSPEEYGSWESSYENTLQDIWPIDESTPPDIISNKQYKPGDEVYVVWVEYSTGDSFGHSYKGSQEAVGVFSDENIAMELVNTLQTHYDTRDQEDFNDRYAFICLTSDGQEFTYGSAPWVGYFEHLESVNCEKIVVSE